MHLENILNIIFVVLHLHEVCSWGRRKLFFIYFAPTQYGSFEKEGVPCTKKKSSFLKCVA